MGCRPMVRKNKEEARQCYHACRHAVATRAKLKISSFILTVEPGLLGGGRPDVGYHNNRLMCFTLPIYPPAALLQHAQTLH